MLSSIALTLSRPSNFSQNPRIGRRWLSTEPATESPVSAPKKPRKRASPVFEDHPANESSLHYKTKAHLDKNMAQTSSLTILKTCSTRCDPTAPAVFPYWSCSNTKKEENWVTGWNATKMEHSLRGVGKFDLALLRGNGADKSSALVAAVEVLVSSPMTDTKVAQLKAKNVPWIEVQASVDLFRDPTKLMRTPKTRGARTSFAPPKAWHFHDPLPVVGTSDGPWTCEVCKQLEQTKKDQIVFESIAGIVDVYRSSTTHHGQGQMLRKAYGIYSHSVPKVWSEPDRPEIKHYFLVSGTSLTTTNRLGLDTLPMDSKLLISTHAIPNYVNGEMPHEIFHQCMLDELRREKAADDGAILDIRLDWPGATLVDFFQRADPMASLIGMQGIKSLGKLHGSLSRLVGFRYRFDRPLAVWVPNRNHKLQPL